MATLKTPGVYVQEISKFPPSVAPVATAIPAFIGYTEKATDLQTGDLNLVPTRITSMLEYEQYFGEAQPETAIAVELNSDDKLVVTNTSASEYLMYYSLQMYFANGGGPCYITSVGSYLNPIVIGDDSSGLKGGLVAVRKEDEPTLLLFPDATALSTSDYYSLQQLSLTQCAELQDRFAIMDTLTDGSGAIQELRDNIGVNNLRYGAAYYPFLDTILDYQYADSSVVVTNNSNPSPTGQIETIGAAIYSRTGALATAIDAMMAQREALSADAATSLTPTDVTDAQNSIQAIINELSGTLGYFNQILSISASETDAGVVAARNTLDAWISANLEVPIAELNAQKDRLALAGTTTKGDAAVILSSSTASTSNTYASLGLSNVTSGTPGTETSANAQIVIDLSVNPTAEISTLVGAYPTVPSTTQFLSDLENTDNDLYNRVKAAISDFPVTLPPSSAMAGIYARVDNAVGVWKAPANETVQYVQQPTVRISNEDQEDMNVTSSGKSVNAIRTFTGKGTLVWGARTLAGNDNEWRYISVRRFFNFVEESVSEATEQYVFQPNTANTWVQIRSLIESFLLQQWKAGALAGSRPEDAYYVRIGLGQTMTAQDVLEGRMIVEIGMAAVRPAEFIVLKFSHKMQEA